VRDVSGLYRRVGRWPGALAPGWSWYQGSDVAGAMAPAKASGGALCNVRNPAQGARTVALKRR